MSDWQRRERGRTAYVSGIRSEARAVASLEAEGWLIIGRRLRTPHGEIDLVADQDGLTAFIEVKSRRSLAAAAASLGSRQRARLLAAAGLLLSAHPDWGRRGVRFDVIVVDGSGRTRRIVDAFRDEG